MYYLPPEDYEPRIAMAIKVSPTHSPKHERLKEWEIDENTKSFLKKEKAMEFMEELLDRGIPFKCDFGLQMLID